MIDRIGRFAVDRVRAAGRFGHFLADLVRAVPDVATWRGPLVVQMRKIGVDSLPVALFIAAFTGVVLALQASYTFTGTVPLYIVGTVVAKTMMLELGPVLTGLALAGRVGASVAAELGTMKVTEQVDALVTLATNPVKYLVVPRVVASTIVLPILVIFADLVGILGGYFVSVYLLGANPYVYESKTYQYLEFKDIYTGLIKAAVFGFLIAIISCYNGFIAEGGAEGVGRATTRAVVASSMVVLISDYFMTSLMF